MSRTAYSLNSYTGGAGAAYLTGSGIGAADTTITITGTNAGWVPLGTAGGWFLDIDYGTANEEKVYVPSGTYSWSSGVVTIAGIVRGIDETNAVVHSGGGSPTGVVCTPVLTAIDTDEANILVAGLLGNGPAPIINSHTVSGTFNVLGSTLLSGTITVSGTMQGNSIYNDPVSVVSANHTAIYNETTVYSGTTAAQTIFLPSGNLVNGCANNIVNYATVSVTVASGSTAQINNFGTLGNVVVQPDHQYDFTYSSTNNTWYVEDSNDVTTTYGSGIAGQHLTPSGQNVVAWSMPTAYAMPPIYLSPYKAWTHDPNIVTATQTLITGTLYYHSIWVPTAMTLSGISCYISTAASGTTWLGLFSAANNQQVAICSGVGTAAAGITTGWHTVPFSGGTYSIAQPGLYYIGINTSGTLGPVTYGPVAGQAALVNMNIGTQTNVLTGLRQASVVVGQRSLYSNGTTVSGSIATTTLASWFALS